MGPDQERVLKLVREGMTVHAALRRVGLRLDMSEQWCHVNPTYATAIRAAMHGDEQESENKKELK